MTQAIKLVVAFLLAGVLMCASQQALAHRFHFGMTEVTYNARTKSTEVVHTYTMHDIDTLLVHLHQRQFDLSDPDDQALLRKYIERQFALVGSDGKAIPLTWIGMTVDSYSVTVYQEAEGTPLSKAARIRNGILIDFLPDQINTVNVHDGRTLRTLTHTSARIEQPLK